MSDVSIPNRPAASEFAHRSDPKLADVLAAAAEIVDDMPLTRDEKDRMVCLWCSKPVYADDVPPYSHAIDCAWLALRVAMDDLEERGPATAAA